MPGRTEMFIDKWINYLRGTDHELARIAATKLGTAKHPTVVQELIKVLHNRPDDLRVAAIRALGSIGDEMAVKPLIELLNDPHPVVSSAAVDALGEIGSPKAVAPLIRVLSDYKQIEDRHERIHGANRGLFMAAIDALTRIDTPEARSAIKKYYR